MDEQLKNESVDSYVLWKNPNEFNFEQTLNLTKWIEWDGSKKDKNDKTDKTVKESDKDISEQQEKKSDNDKISPNENEKKNIEKDLSTEILPAVQSAIEKNFNSDLYAKIQNRLHFWPIWEMKNGQVVLDPEITNDISVLLRPITSALSNLHFENLNINNTPIQIAIMSEDPDVENVVWDWDIKAEEQKQPVVHLDASVGVSPLNNYVIPSWVSLTNWITPSLYWKLGIALPKYGVALVTQHFTDLKKWDPKVTMVDWLKLFPWNKEVSWFVAWEYINISGVMDQFWVWWWLNYDNKSAHLWFATIINGNITKAWDRFNNTCTSVEFAYTIPNTQKVNVKPYIKWWTEFKNEPQNLSNWTRDCVKATTWVELSDKDNKFWLNAWINYNSGQKESKMKGFAPVFVLWVNLGKDFYGR